MKKVLTLSLLATAFVLNAVTPAHAQGAKPISPPKAQPLGYMVISYDIKDQAEFKKYMDAAGTLAAKFNGKVTIFNMNVKGEEGKPRSVFGMVEFPNLADAERFYRSPEYTAARKFAARRPKEPARSS